MDVKELQGTAEIYRAKYNLGQCSREEAKKYIMPYINEVNKKGLEIAKKYNRKPIKITFYSYIR